MLMLCRIEVKLLRACNRIECTEPQGKTKPNCASHPTWGRGTQFLMQRWCILNILQIYVQCSVAQFCTFLCKERVQSHAPKTCGCHPMSSANELVSDDASCHHKFPLSFGWVEFDGNPATSTFLDVSRAGHQIHYSLQEIVSVHLHIYIYVIQYIMI